MNNNCDDISFMCSSSHLGCFHIFLITLENRISIFSASFCDEKPHQMTKESISSTRLVLKQRIMMDNRLVITREDGPSVLLLQMHVKRVFLHTHTILGEIKQRLYKTERYIENCDIPKEHKNIVTLNTFYFK